MTSFSDDFNRGDSTDLGAGWVEVGVTDWAIVSQQLSPGSSGATIVVRAATAMATSDNWAQVTIAATSSVSQGVMCRGDSTLANGYLWRNNGTNWGLFKAVSGTFTAIGTTYAAAAVAGDVAKVQAVGSTIKGFVNGVERASVTDTAVTTGTAVGIRSQSTSALRYDDFSAADVVTGATLGIASATETALALTSSKTATLAPATTTETAQQLTGAKAAALTASAATEAAQALAGAKAGSLGVAAASETAQQLAGSKTAELPVVLESVVAEAFAGTKTALLSAAIVVEAAQALTGVVSRTLGAAVVVEAVQPLAGVKGAVLGPAEEISAARPVAAAGVDEDVGVTVGAPYSPWTVGAPQPGRWEVGAPW